jgi:hypothetical protein
MIDAFDGEDLIAHRPQQTTENPARHQVEDMHTGPALVWIESGSVMRIAGQDAAGTDKGQMIVEEKAARPTVPLEKIGSNCSPETQPSYP